MKTQFGKNYGEEEEDSLQYSKLQVLGCNERREVPIEAYGCIGPSPPASPILLEKAYLYCAGGGG